MRFLPLLTMGLLGHCGPSAPRLPTSPDAPTHPDPPVAEVLAHSTLADTLGLNADLRLIEERLGPLGPEVKDNLRAVEVRYFSFMDSTYTMVDTQREYSGILIVHACIAKEVERLFEILKRDTFPIAKVVPINRYGLNADSTGWDDEASMAANNTSAFNYRTKPTSSEPSKHAMGIAIDINPRQNPLVRRNGEGTTVQPPGTRYDAHALGALNRSNTTRYLSEIGWSWGGRWPRPQDHQHIEKSRGSCAHFRFSLN